MVLLVYDFEMRGRKFYLIYNYEVSKGGVWGEERGRAEEVV